VTRRISNWEYLLRLNAGSGRSYLDVSQYPIMPWIISDYVGSDFARVTLRDLSKPMGALTESRLRDLREKAKMLAAMGMGEYLYSSGYWCPLNIGL
jgi:hypothetical protein